MKLLVKEEANEGLASFLGQRVTLYCMNYIYTGTLTGINDSCVKLEDAAVVYETGPYDTNTWKDAQKLPAAWYVNVGTIESFGKLK